MTPNLARNGQIVRAVSGTLCIAGALALWLIGWPESTALRATLALILALFGGFQWFEAKTRW